MEPDRWRQIETLYQAAVELEGEERDALLQRACGADAELRREVEALLAYDARAGDFIKSPAIDAVARMIAERQDGPKPRAADLSGTRVSHYRILQKLGGGGMGVVYKAEDTKLGRFVALKFLPDDLVHDPLAMERFRREARAASALDHPHICTIYEINEDESGPFIAMQYLEGQTLRHRIEANPLKTDELLDVAIQIAEGLAAAHAKGIVHRDIKPANILINSHGQAKILDFGLAKLTSGEGHEARTDSIDLQHLTSPGTAMGTIAYMSPEQARGEELDVRTDLFSFGAVLYEMATGRQAFAGATTALIHDAILNRTPEPVSRVNSKVPADLDRIAGRLLEKDRDLRYQSAADLRSDLKRLKRDTDSGRSAALSAAVAGASHARDAGVAAGRTPALRRWPLWLAGSLAVILAGIAWFLRRPPAPHPAVELTQKPLTYNSSENPVSSSAISPDGKYLAYADSAGIHVRLLSTGDERLIQKPPGSPADAAWGLDSWFPDSTRLLADTYEPGGRQSMWTVSVLGQSGRQLRDRAGGFEVSPDGAHIAFSPTADLFGESREVWLMSSQGENLRKALALRQDEWLGSVHWSPDGRRLAFISHDRLDSIETCDLNGANRTVVVTEQDPNATLQDFCWLPDRRIIYSRTESDDWDSSNLWQAGIDTRSGRNAGKPKRLTQWAGSNLAGLTATADGKRLVLLKGLYQGHIYVSQLTAGGTRISRPQRLTNDEVSEWPLAWTADSKALLFLSGRTGGRGAVFRKEIGPKPAESASAEPREIGGPSSGRLSPDGAWLVYLDNPKQSPTEARVMRLPVNGGIPQFVMEARFEDDIITYSCARAPANLCVILEGTQDGKRLTLTAFDPVKGRGKLLRTIDKDPFAGDYWWPRLSPDGSTYAIPRYGEPDIHIRLLSLMGGPDREVTVKGWPNFAGLEWSPDGKALYCASVSPHSRSLLYVDLKGNAKVLWQLPGGRGENASALQGAGHPLPAVWGLPSPDGRHLVIEANLFGSNAWLLEGF